MTVDEWGKLYRDRRRRYQEFQDRTEALVYDLLKASKIDYVQVESRTKTVDSFMEKIQRKGREKVDPFDSIDDIVGIRVIVYYLEDVASVGEFLEREFEVEFSASEDKVDRLAPDQFGYRSSHYVARLSEERKALAEWQQYADLRAEFQVRTALQHAWAAISHKVEYKQVEAAPKAVSRKLHRLSALFEIADEEFSSLRDQSEQTKSSYSTDVKEGDLDLPIDSSSISVYWSLSSRSQEVREWMKVAGLEVTGRSALEDEQVERDVSDLVTIMKKYGFDSLAEFDDLLANNTQIPAAMAAMAKVDSGDDLEGSFEDLMTQVLIVMFDDSDRPGIEVYSAETVDSFLKAKEVYLGSGNTDNTTKEPIA